MLKQPPGKQLNNPEIQVENANKCSNYCHSLMKKGKLGKKGTGKGKGQDTYFAALGSMTKF